LPQGVRVNIRFFGIDALNELDKISDINMVNYYKDELDKLDRGLNYKLKILSRRMLYKRDIIYIHHSTRRNCLTPKGKEILNSLK
jgi:hypothetical protein